jgi:hypothetical protein
VTKAAVQAEYRVNGSNQRDTGHWIWSAPPAAMAEKGKDEHLNLNFRFWPGVTVGQATHPPIHLI